MRYVVTLALLPLLTTVGIAGATIAALRSLDGAAAARAAVWALSAQIVVTAASWLAVDLLPDDPNRLDTAPACPHLDAFGASLLIGICVAAAVLGGVALGTSVLAARAGIARTRLVAFGPVACVLPYAASLALGAAVLCGLD